MEWLRPDFEEISLACEINSYAEATLKFRLVHIKILGSAAGGGFPQWNCACRNCRELRAGKLNTSARTQCQVAVSGSHGE